MQALNREMSIYKEKAREILKTEYIDQNKRNEIETIDSDADKLRKGVTLDNLPQVPF